MTDQTTWPLPKFYFSVTGLSGNPTWTLNHACRTKLTGIGMKSDGNEVWRWRVSRSPTR